MIAPDSSANWPRPTDGWPSWVASTPYVGAAHPQQRPQQPIANGANCQRYAYAILGLFGRTVPDHRSSELWAEPAFEHPAEPQDLDLVLFNSDVSAWGAHVGVVLADGVLHLSTEVTIPAVWTWQRFAERPKYRTVVGFVRVPSPPSQAAS